MYTCMYTSEDSAYRSGVALPWQFLTHKPGFMTTISQSNRPFLRITKGPNNIPWNHWFSLLVSRLPFHIREYHSFCSGSSTWRYLLSCDSGQLHLSCGDRKWRNIYALLTKLVRSRWLDIGQVLFCVFMDRDEVEVHKNAKKNEANIQPSWPNKLGQ